MAEGSRFLVIEFSGNGLTLGEWTRDHPGTTIDLISEPVRAVGPDRVHPSLFLVKGANRAALVQLMDRLDRLYGPLDTLRMEPTRGQWMGRMHVKESAMNSAATAAVLQFQHRLGAPWTHIDDGVVYLRARLPAGEDGERLLHQVRGYLAKSGADAQVSLQEFSTHDYGVWDDLVQASIGLAP
ncbi:MAG: hypothetical protein AABY18_10290 [Candidatus Thermoplasmatota archaeon]